MMNLSWIKIIGLALGSGITVKILDIVYQEIQRWRSTRQTATTFIDDHLDPLLKSADELNGKLRSLAENDFKALHKVADSEFLTNTEFASLLFLFGKFWAQIEIIRHEGMSVAMAKDGRGARLQSFFDCLESRRVRIVDRILQRAVGEVFIKETKTTSFVDFMTAFENENNTRKWVTPLAKFLSRMEHTTERQQLLQYGAVIHALIDNLDPDHLVTRERPSWPNKLSGRSWRDLNYRVFGVYLKFVTNRRKYLGPPKKAARKKRGGKPVKTLEP
jgi:hypothetical protein